MFPYKEEAEEKPKTWREKIGMKKAKAEKETPPAEKLAVKISKEEYEKVKKDFNLDDKQMKALVDFAEEQGKSLDDVLAEIAPKE